MKAARVGRTVERNRGRGVGRHPDVDVRGGKREGGGHDGDDRDRRDADGEGPPENALDRFTALAREAIADDRHRRRAAAVEWSAGFGPGRQRVEELVVDHGDAGEAGLSRATHREPVAPIARHALERRQAPPPLRDLWKRRLGLHDGEPFRMRVWKWPEQHTIGHGEDRGVQAGAQRGGHDRGAGRPGIREKPPRGDSDLHRRIIPGRVPTVAA